MSRVVAVFGLLVPFGVAAAIVHARAAVERKILVGMSTTRLGATLGDPTPPAD
jgi:hypothetical protein